ncbi:class I SAM-dependent methyltransferase [bacterium]|nr:class I SAM-dependent methyltransferase [bacterium]
MLKTHCRGCGAERGSDLFGLVPGTTQRLHSIKYSVWLCSQCHSYNAVESVDFDDIYSDYPIQKQKLDLFTKMMFAKRLRILKCAGVKKTDSIFDYGCGSGHFVGYLKQHGYRCVGYDPYNKHFNQKELLQQHYDVVISQDVVEHTEDPKEILKNFRRVRLRNKFFTVV